MLGIVVGDNTWLRALQLLGARRVILVDALKPWLAAILGHFLLDEVRCYYDLLEYLLLRLGYACGCEYGGGKKLWCMLDSHILKAVALTC